MSKHVTFYTRKQCPLCEEARALLLMLQNDYSFIYEEFDIHEDDDLLEKYQLAIPVVEIDGEQLVAGQIDYFSLVNKLEEKNAEES